MRIFKSGDPTANNNYRTFSILPALPKKELHTKNNCRIILISTDLYLEVSMVVLVDVQQFL